MDRNALAVPAHLRRFVVDQDYRQCMAVRARETANIDWLLRWVLLAGLIKTGADARLAQALREELERLEVDLDHQQPIAMGLRACN